MPEPDLSTAKLAAGLAGAVVSLRFVAGSAWERAVMCIGGAALSYYGTTPAAIWVGMPDAEGLDAMAYGVLCYDAWDAQPEIVESWGAEYDDAENLVKEAGTHIVSQARAAGDRYGIRYDELLTFIITSL